MAYSRFSARGQSSPGFRPPRPPLSLSLSHAIFPSLDPLPHIPGGIALFIRSGHKNTDDSYLDALIGAKNAAVAHFL